MLKWFLISCLWLFVSCSNNQTQSEGKQATKNSEQDTVKLLFVGDLLLDRGVRERIEHAGISSLFTQKVDSVFAASNLVVANLECPATKIQEPINKKYIFRAEPEWLGELKKHGITHLNLANNHSMDQGRNGLSDTDKNIKELGLIPLGFGINEKEACVPHLIANSPRKIYVLSSVQVPSENWSYLPDQPCVCENSYEKMKSQIEHLKSEDPGSIILVQLHWGVEHTLEPMIKQKQIAHELIDAGVDGIIGHHPHAVQTIEQYKGKSIFYSIGNFIFDQKKEINSKGIMVKGVVSASGITFDTIQFTINNCVPDLNR